MNMTYVMLGIPIVFSINSGGHCTYTACTSAMYGHLPKAARPGGPKDEQTRQVPL